MPKTTAQITADLQAIVNTTGASYPIDRPVSWMRVRRAVGTYLRATFGYNYYVKVRATREQRLAGIIQVRALFAGEDVSMTYHP